MAKESPSQQATSERRILAATRSRSSGPHQRAGASPQKWCSEVVLAEFATMSYSRATRRTWAKFGKAQFGGARSRD